MINNQAVSQFAFEKRIPAGSFVCINNNDVIYILRPTYEIRKYTIDEIMNHLKEYIIESNILINLKEDRLYILSQGCANVYDIGDRHLCLKQMRLSV